MNPVVWKVLLGVFLGYVTLTLVIFLCQRKFLYFPNKSRLSEKQALQLRLRYWPSEDNFRGFVSTEEVQDVKGTVLVFHGNADAAYHRIYYIDALVKQSLRVILAEYPGYGGRNGHPSEKVFVDDALETLRLAYELYGTPLLLWGESLGSGVVSSLIAQTEVPIKGVILFLPWDSLSQLAQTHYRFLPARLLLLDKYNNI